MKKYILFCVLLFQIQIWSQTTNVTATVYHAVAEQCNADYLHTAWMFKINPENPYSHRLIAVSRDLIPMYPNGSKVRLEGTKYDGIYTIRDKMNKRYTKSIDILINKGMRIGKWTENVTITKLHEVVQIKL